MIAENVNTRKGQHAEPADAFTPEVEETVPRVDWIMLSHPHQDHGMLLHDVLRCYEVGEVYDVGVLNDKRFYRGFLEAVAEEPDVTYWTVVDPPSPKTIDIYGAEINFTDVTWNTFAEGHVIELGAGAKLIVLAANGDHHPNDFNENSLVVRLELGDHSALLMGDAEAGDRVSPDEDPPPTAKKDDAHQHEEHTEGYLMRYHAAEIDVDILQVGHHGSMTSSRPDFIAAVSPTWSLIGAGPRRYTGHRLPDATVQRMLEDLAKEAGGFVLNTDFDDRRCPVANRVGRDHRPDEGNGGCSNYVLFLGP